MRNINLPKARIYIRKDAWGGSENEFEPAWLVSVRALRGRPFCFQAWIDGYAACYDKIRPDCIYWKLPEDNDPYHLTDIQMWECLSSDIELFHKAQLADVPMLVNMSDEFAEGNYWFTIDCIPEKQSLGYLDVGDADLLDEHKEMNVIRLKNGQIAIYPNNRLKWIPESLTTKEAIQKKPEWKVAQNSEWDIEWLEQPYELYGDSEWSY
tara:strand:+ start:249 stop:875 length:627 start_codon:yes stop_codon:yes gene_type:complete